MLPWGQQNSPFGPNPNQLIDRIERTVRNAIIRGLDDYKRMDAQNEVDWQLTLTALDKLKFFRVINDKLATFAEMGIPTYNGILPYWAIEEHRMIKSIINKANADKPPKG